MKYFGFPAVLALALVPTASAQTSSGCYLNPNGYQSGFRESFAVLNSNKLTRDSCRQYCSRFGTNYCAVQNGQYCSCGDTILPGANKQANEQLCNKPCAGGGSGSCGATRYLSVFESLNNRSIGQWSRLIKFPMVPVAVAVLPKSGKLLAWSSGFPNRWTNAGNKMTYTAVYNPADGNVSSYLVQNTQHDMFCPGISIDAEGRIIVTGGSSAAKTSIYDADKNGRLFTIGGTFSGFGTRNGELYDGSTDTWTKLPGCPLQPMVMRQGLYPDAHGWLLGWKDGFVLQAGPSRNMNWYDTKDTGAVQSAGTRAQDGDAMCGVFVMYDAVAGKVFTYGGGQAYTGFAATTSAHILTLGEPGQAVAAEKVGNGAYGRGFGNGVVLPDGTVFVVGGQGGGPMALFTDASATLVPELFDPVRRTFTPLRAHATPRNYHSTVVLMPDATVFSGGGGLCGEGCAANHFDGQFFSPPYLFLADGRTPAPRPEIALLSADTVRAGETYTITMAERGTYTFSMIRTGTSTHAVNTDQRRIPLVAQEGDGINYQVTVPNDYGVALPGYYMVFAISETGVPCTAKFIKVAL
ncbi:galactose oxidase precursor protein [Apiospora hydei]|uniref:Galactose oxidase protein n=1 Tax=Apiospora hydei TaxID=1337664 RepID=A0ABR1WNJ9_9PEZI